MSYKINDAPPAMVTIGMSTSGGGIALKGDVVGFLLMLPREGVRGFRVADRRGETLEAEVRPVGYQKHDQQDGPPL